MQPKVSVIVPVYNNEKYVVPCMRSLLAQTLEDIEIICINDGSTDRSSEILHGFAEQDGRVVVIDKENGGYGVGINRGLDEAHGKYVTILESDDFADLDMLEQLYAYAEAFELDVVRANFYLYWSSRIKKDVALTLFGPYECDRVIDPSRREDQHCFYAQPALWSALYRTDFIRSNKLRLLETPGAAYQDTAFNFKIWACARRVMFVYKPFVHYRQDNEASSINDKTKVYNICLEYHEIDRWLTEERPELRESLAPVMWKMMCDAYTWNAGRVADEYKLDFVKRYGEELAKAEAAGEVDESLFAPGQYAMVHKTITDPEGYIGFITRGDDPDHGLALMARKVATAGQVLSQRGAHDLMQLVKDKLTSSEYEPTMVDEADAAMIVTRAPHLVREACAEPKVSVVLPVYNTASVLAETMDSILSQTLQDFELICVNDGSTDDSLEMLRSYAAKDARVKVFSQANAGAAAARNAGLAHVSAPYTMILDSDDVFDFRMFEHLYERAERTEADVVVCKSCEYDDVANTSAPMDWALKVGKLPKDDAFTPQQAAGQLFEAFMGWPWDRIYRTDLIRANNLRFPELANSEDALFVYEALLRSARLAILPEVLIRHRMSRAGSVSNSRAKNPECFYEVTCLIKDVLRADAQTYALYEKSFLNWAFDYALWNVSSLPEGEARTMVARKLLTGEYPEIEVGSHPMEYFNLYPDIKRRYEALGKEFEA